MCGLVGILGDIPYDVRGRVFRDMLDVCQTRGRDSTGVIKVDKTLDYDWVKQVGPPSVLCDTRTYEARIERGDATALIGHCRSKTVGEVNVKSAHPFDYPDEGICGVHNGTLRAYHNLDTHAHGKVDSEILYGHLAKNGPDETFPILEGAFACVWWDNNTKTVNFIRNDQRPLWFTWSEDKKMMFWASETWFFGAVARKVKLWDGGEDKKPYIELPKDTLWSFKVNVAAKKDEPTVIMSAPREIKPAEKKVQNYNYNYQQRKSWEEGWEQMGNGQYVRRLPPPDSPRKNADSFGKKPATGGEVPDPFRMDRTKLDDPLPIELAHTGKESSDLSNVSFLRHSITSSGSSTGGKPLTPSQRKTLSLAGKSSLDSLTKNNGEPFDCSAHSSPSTLLRMPPMVSLREVAGLRYITNNTTKDEWDVKTFFENTKGECCFCHEHVTGLGEVGAIFNAYMFMCKECLVEPKETSRMIA